MKIGFDGRFIQKTYSGNGVFSKMLLQSLAEIDERNEYIVYLVEENGFLKKRNFNLKKMPFVHRNAYLRFFVTFPAALYRKPVDIFHAIYTIPFKVPAKVVLSQIEFFWLTEPEHFPRFLQLQLRLITKHAVGRADKIITPTQFVGERLLDYFNLPPSKIEVIPFGYNEYFLERSSSTEITKTREKYRLGDYYILTVGDLQPRKNLERLVDAFNNLKKAHKIPHKLVIVGRPVWGNQGLFQKISQSKFKKEIILTGYVPITDLKSIYQGADVFVFPTYNEGFGLPVHEAMASQTPVVSSNSGSLPEIVGDAALLFNPLNTEEISEAIYSVIANPTLRTKLVEKGLERIEHFSWKESAKKILRVYEELSDS